MAYDNTKPADNQKIRLVPQDVRDNFVAIETGDTTFQQDISNYYVQGADPAALADNVRVYSKIGNGANAELFKRNAAGDVVQITQDTKLGSNTTPLLGNSLQLDTSTPTLTFASANMIVAHASVTSAGVLTNGLNVTAAARSAEGKYTITVAAGVLQNNNYRVIGTVDNTTSDSIRNFQMKVKPNVVIANATVIPIRITGGSTLHDENFDVIIVGGR